MRLAAASGENRSSRQPIQCPAPAHRPATPGPASTASGPGRLRESRHSPASTAAGDQLADEYGVRCHARLRTARPSPRSSGALAPRLAPSRPSQAPKNSGRSRVRTCGPSLVRRVITVAGRGPAWHLPAMTVAGRGLVWPGAGGRWLPVWLPRFVSAANLQHCGRQPETRHGPAMAASGFPRASA
jgi:hypothetical protein